MRKTIYITSVGVNNYAETTYLIKDDNKKITTKFAGYAIKKLVPELKNADTYLIATTDSLKKYQKDIYGLLDHPKIVEIPFVKSSDEFNVLFNTVFEYIPHDGEIDLYIDITSAYRSLQFVLFAVLMYLSGLESTSLKGVYYGAYEARDKQNNTPIIQINSIFDMIDWFYASRLFKEFGLSRHLGRKLEETQNNCHKNKCKNPPKKLTSFGRILRSISFGLYNADALSVIEKCYSLESVVNGITDELKNFIPIAKPLIDKTLTEYNALKSDKNAVFDQHELNAEAKLIDWYINHEQYKNACTLMREWVVNQVIMGLGYETRTNWLDYGKTRKQAEKIVTRLNIFHENESYHKFLNIFSEDAQKVSGHVKKLFDMRNRLSHGGFTTKKNECIDQVEKKTKEIWAEIQAIPPQTYINAYDRNIKIDTLLITPLGLSPGVLYTLLTCDNQIYDTKNTEILILTSKKAETFISVCCDKANNSPSFTVELLDDPHKQIKTQDELEQRHLEKMLSARQVVINYTGGTSIMQVNAQNFAKIAKKFNLELKEVVVIDERSIDEQRKNPFVTGLIQELI